MAFHFEIINFGWIGVQLFFVLSGFLITGILWKEKFSNTGVNYKFKKFWVRRSLRIFPLYFGYLFFFGLTYLIFHFPSYYLFFFPYLISYTFNFTFALPGFHINTPLFTHLWSLCVEEQFYFVFPLIVFFCTPKFIKWFLIIMIFLAPFIRYFLGMYYVSKGYTPLIVSQIVYANTLSHVDAFFLGGLSRYLHLKGKKLMKFFY